MRLRVLPGRYAVCRSDCPPRLAGAMLEALLHDRDGWTWVGPEDKAPDGAGCQPGWRALEVEGPLDFALTGVLAGLTRELARAEVPVFALSTWSTDFLLVPASRLQDAFTALRNAGHELTNAENPG